MSEGYKYLDHTADIEFLAYADEFETLFENALLAMFNTIADIKKLEKWKSKEHLFEIKADVQGSSITDLMWETLQSALSQAEANGLFAYKVTDTMYKNWRGKTFFFAKCHAKEKDQKFAKFEVKGVSKFDLKFKERGIDYKDKDHEYEITVVLDV